MSDIQLTDEEIASRLRLIAAVITPTQGVRNDIISVGADCVRLKSARTGNLHKVPFRDLRQADKVTTNGVSVRLLARILGLYSGPELDTAEEPDAATASPSPSPAMRFDEVLEAVSQQSPENQEILIEVVRHRLHAQRRAALVKEVEEADREFEAGLCEERTPEEIIREALS